MTQQYLILHKVRGEPAFDIAEECMIGDEKGWVVSTSGHRAYPYATWRLSDLSLLNGFSPPVPLLQGMSKYPPREDWPDHYEPRREPKQSIDITSFLSSLVNFKRRI